MPENSALDFHFLNYRFNQLVFVYLSFHFLIHSESHVVVHSAFQLLLGDLVLLVLLLQWLGGFQAGSPLPSARPPACPHLPLPVIVWCRNVSQCEWHVLLVCSYVLHVCSCRVSGVF